MSLPNLPNTVTNRDHGLRRGDRIVINGRDPFVVLRSTDSEMVLMTRSAWQGNQLFESVFMFLVGAASIIALVVATAWWLQ